MNSKEEFFNTILKHYTEISQNAVPEELLKGVSNRITDYYYEQYERFGRQYPKSIKKYSSFQIKDLDHPYTFEIIIKYFKEKLGTNSGELINVLLKMNDSQLNNFIKNREEFRKMF